VASPVDDLAERLTELEIRVEFQDRLVRTLDDVVHRFATRVEVLERELSELRSGDGRPPSPIGPAAEKPPHY